MIWEWVRFGISALLILAGVLFELISIFGLYRLNYVLNRMHAAAIGDTLGISLVLLGLIVVRGVGYDSLKLLAVIFFLWLASPVSSHLIAKMEATINPNSRHYRTEKR